ncbi:MFS transporter L2 [Cladobotryum mycophilum]|uniref:MFS transporter L2 n=1 Tax=Cladobotryum mycophilum TaxID=491253 RepID=A0ABR0T2L8_9HYPO
MMREKPDYGENVTTEGTRAESQDDPMHDDRLRVDALIDPPIEGQRKKKKPLAFYLSFLAINIIVFVFSLDSTTLAVAIPSIAEQLHGTTLQSFWASISFLLAVVITQPLYTSLSDIYGRKPLLQIAFLFFAIGSLVFALAQDMVGIIGGRVLQGLGGGGLDVLGEIIVADMTTLKDRSIYLGIMAIPTAAGSILGPSIGAIFSQYASWRWIGWINLPYLGVAYPLVVFFLRLQRLEVSLLEKTKQLDWIGMALFSVGCLAFVLPLSWAGTLYPWSSWRTIVPLLLGALVLATFVVYESKAIVPILPYRLFRSRTMTVTLAGAFVHGMMLFALMQYLPFFYQAILRKTLIQSALLLLPTSIASVLAAGLSVTAVGFAGTYRWSVWLSWVLVTAGTGLLVLLSESSTTAIYYGLPIIWGVGIGALLRVLHLPLQASVPTVDDTGLAIGLLMFSRLLGGLVGLAISSTIFSSVFESSIAAMGSALPESVAFLQNANEAIGFIPRLRTVDLSPEVLSLIIHAYLTSFRAIFYTMTGFGALGFIVSLFIEDLDLQKEELGRQQFQS